MIGVEELELVEDESVVDCFEDVFGCCRIELEWLVWFVVVVDGIVIWCLLVVLMVVLG